MLAPVENTVRRRQCGIVDAEDPLYLHIALTVLIPDEEATVRASEERFRSDHWEVGEWAKYDEAHSRWLQQVEAARGEQVTSRFVVDGDEDDHGPALPPPPTCARPSAEYKKTFDERIAQLEDDREHLRKCKQRARERLVAHVHPSLYSKGAVGGVGHDAFYGLLGKRGRA